MKSKLQQLREAIIKEIPEIVELKMGCKIKRILARIGIGSPLNMLFYTSKEIEDKKKRGEMMNCKNSLQNKKHSKDYFNGYSAGYTQGCRVSQRRHRKYLRSGKDLFGNTIEEIDNNLKDFNPKNK